jgi:hypothetical protein
VPTPIRRLYVPDDPRLGLRLVFETRDLELIREVTYQRFRKNRENGNINGATHPEKGEGQDQTGTPGEVAWWLAHGVQPTIADLVRPDYIAGEIDAFGAEVRSTEYGTGCLLIQGIKTSKKDHAKVEAGVPFVLAIVAQDHVDFRGYFIPKGRLRSEWWREDWKRKCFAVPQSILFSLIPSFEGGIITPTLRHPRVLLRRWLRGADGPRFEPNQIVPEGYALSEEEAYETGIALWTRTAYVARYGHVPGEVAQEEYVSLLADTFG